MNITGWEFHRVAGAGRLRTALSALWSRLLKGLRYHPEKRYMRPR